MNPMGFKKKVLEIIKSRSAIGPLGFRYPLNLMGKYGKDMAPISTQAEREKADYIQARAARLNWRRSAFMTELINWWFEQGCPPVSYADSVMPRLKYPLDAEGEKYLPSTTNDSETKEFAAKISKKAQESKAHQGRR